MHSPLHTHTLQAYCDPATFSSAPLCISVLRNALQLIDRIYSEEETKHLRRRHPEFVNALFSFALMPRSEDGLPKSNDSLSDATAERSGSGGIPLRHCDLLTEPSRIPCLVRAPTRTSCSPWG